MNDYRYFVDERSGCIAVRDNTLTDPEYNGLHSDTAGIVGYWYGELVQDTCPTCGHVRGRGYVVLDEARKKACALCNKLNREAMEL